MEVWLKDPIHINKDLYSCWLEGESEIIAANARSRVDKEFSPWVLLQDTKDQYRTFGCLEPFFVEPRLLARQNVVPLPAHMQKMLIERYYAYDDKLMREIAGKQLTSRLRRDLDEVSKCTASSPKSCWRQFDNLKRIYKGVDGQFGRLEEIIAKKFKLEPALSRCYSSLVFITNNRLSLEKKNLADIQLQSFLDCSQVFMQQWTSLSIQLVTEGHTIDADDQDLDRNFLQELRELKPTLLTKDVVDELCRIGLRMLSRTQSINDQPHQFLQQQQHHHHQQQQQQRRNDNTDEAKENVDLHKELHRELLSQSTPPPTKKQLANLMRAIVINILHIGAGLSHSRELRDIFEDIVDRLVMRCRALNCTQTDIQMLFDCLLQSYPQLSSLSTETRLRFLPIFKRLIEGLCQVTLILYRAT